MRPTGTVETVKALTGLPINYLITVNFRGFTQVVDKLGGVWIDVDRRYFNDNSDGYDRYAAIDLQPGYQRLFGRHGAVVRPLSPLDNDIIRNARQQLFVRAVKDRIDARLPRRHDPQGRRCPPQEHRGRRAEARISTCRR